MTGEPRVLCADHAFEIRELADELRCLVGLREQRCLSRVFITAELGDELGEPVCLLGERAAALDERDPVEPVRQLVDTDCDVAVERERRVLEPRLEHTRVAGTDDVDISPGRDDGEAVLAEREVALVALHGSDDHALRQAEEALVELRCEDERPFDHVHDLVELPERVLPVAERVERFHDVATALVCVGLDVRGAKRVHVGLAEAISTSPCVKRWPKDVPEPASVSSSSFSQNQRTGRAKRPPLSSQRIDLPNSSP